MPPAPFNRDSQARTYAAQHYRTDPAIREIHYLPTNAPEREIRLVEVNESIADRREDSISPIDFGVETGTPAAHSLFVLDVTPAQWVKIRDRKLRLPPGWSLESSVPVPRRTRTAR